MRDRILPVLPKPLLAALIGISLSLNLALFFYILRLRKQRRLAQARLVETQTENARLQDEIDNPPLKFIFGVYWDRHGTPFCPVHQTTPLGNWLSRLGSQRNPGYMCPVGAHLVPLKDDAGRLVTPADAKRQLLPTAQLESGGGSEPDTPEDSTDELDADSLRLLRIIANPNYEKDEDAIIQYMSLHPQRVRHHLSLLEQGEYIYANQ